jgi:hypothetical protein
MSSPPDYIKELFLMIRELSNKIDNLTESFQESNEYTKSFIQTASTTLENLENKLSHYEANGHHNETCKKTAILLPDFIPEIGFNDWLLTFEINKYDMQVLFGTSILDGFKHCISKNMEIIEGKPIWISDKKTKQIYIYDFIGESELNWRIMTEEDIFVVIDNIWRKMVEFYFIKNEEEYIELSDEEQTQRDINKKYLIDMKKKLIQKHVKDIARHIVLCYDKK